MAKRDYKDPEYTKARAKVRKRDKRKCQMPGCRRRKRLQVHHIIPWSVRPDLRYELSNMITLCYDCHKLVTGSEGFYEALFREIVGK